MVKTLRKVDFSHSADHYMGIFVFNPPPPDKILGEPVRKIITTG